MQSDNRPDRILRKPVSRREAGVGAEGNAEELRFARVTAPGGLPRPFRGELGLTSPDSRGVVMKPLRVVHGEPREQNVRPDVGTTADTVPQSGSRWRRLPRAKLSIKSGRRMTEVQRLDEHLTASPLSLAVCLT